MRRRRSRLLRVHRRAWYSFLDKMRKETTDKIVLISNYTETLDVFEKLLRSKRCVHYHLSPCSL